MMNGVPNGICHVTTVALTTAARGRMFAEKAAKGRFLFCLS
jgi:hypothetical protein